MNITKGPKKTAIKVGVYGTEGVGKTTFTGRFPGVVFIDTEGSTNHMDVARFDQPKTLKEVKDQIQYVIDHPADFGTLAIDTVDWLERIIFNAVCEEKKLASIEDMGYGKGYVLAKDKMKELLSMLDQVIAKGVNVVLVCHSMIRKFELPDEMGNYDRYMLKLNEKNIAPLVKEWVDMLLFVNYRTDVIKVGEGKNQTTKGRGGQKRIMYAAHNACWDAKNRFGLPDEMPFEFDQIAHLFTDAPAVEAVHIAEPEPEPKKPIEIQKPTAEVTIGGTVPGIGATTKKKETQKQEITERPDCMKSEDPDKDKLLDKVWKQMIGIHVPDPLALQAVVAKRGYYDVGVSVKDYDTDFIEGCLIEAWDQVGPLVNSQYNELPF